MKAGMNTLMSVVVASLLLVMSGSVVAHGCHEEHQGHEAKHDHKHGHGEKSDTEVHSGKGELRDIQADEKRVTLWHEPMASLGWPEMTMEFELASPDLVEGFEAGDSVQFEMTSEDGTHTIIKLEKR